jgi:hypothetical protein
MDNPSIFKRDGYVKVSNMLDKGFCDVCTQYALFRKLNNFSPEDENQQIPGTHSEYGDSLMESLLLYLKPNVEKHTGLKLIPTYSYYRVYKPGDILKIHSDRYSCEISQTLTLGYKYNDTTPDYKWGMYIMNDDDKKYIPCEPGESIIYRGVDKFHGRDEFIAGEYSYHVQVFLHYVDANGPYADQYRYDKRRMIGIKKNR